MGLVLVVILYVAGRFSYFIDDCTLTMEWHVLGGVPFGRWSMPIRDVEDVHLFDAATDFGRALLVYGNPLGRHKVTLVLDRKGLRARRVLMTPDRPREFIERLKAKRQECSALPDGG